MAGCNNVIKVDSRGEDEGMSILKYTRKIGRYTSPCPEMHYPLRNPSAYACPPHLPSGFPLICPVDRYAYFYENRYINIYLLNLSRVDS